MIQDLEDWGNAASNEQLVSAIIDKGNFLLIYIRLKFFHIQYFRKHTFNNGCISSS